MSDETQGENVQHSIQKIPSATPGVSPMLPEPPEYIKKFIDNQSKEIEIRGQELAIREKEIETSHQYSNRALDAQAEDRKDERRYKRGARRDRYALAAFSLLVGAGLFSFALASGHEAAAMEALKYLLIVGASGVGGYGIRKAKEPDPKLPVENDD